MENRECKCVGAREFLMALYIFFQIFTNFPDKIFGRFVPENFSNKDYE